MFHTQSKKINNKLITVIYKKIAILYSKKGEDE